MGGYRVLLDPARGRGRAAPSCAPTASRSRTARRCAGSVPGRAGSGVPSMMVSHESLDGLLRLFGAARSRWVADKLNARSAAAYDRIVCTTGWAAAEFTRLGVATWRAYRWALILIGSPRPGTIRRCGAGGPRPAMSCWCTAGGCRRRNSRAVRWRPWPRCAPPGCPRCWWLRVAVRCARPCRRRRPSGRCRCGSSATCGTGPNWPRCSRRRTSPSHRARSRRSAWLPWRRWPAVRR